MKIDFHTHTNSSYDAISSPREIVESAISRGLDAVCITDHHEIKGSLKALSFSYTKKIFVIPGIETRSREGDILGIGIKEKIPDGRGAKETVIAINKLGGLAVIAHPFVWFRGFEGNILKLFHELTSLNLAIEAWNASVPDFFNKKAFFFANKFNLPFTAGSDAHGAEFVGNAFLEIEGEELSVREIFSAIKNKKAKIRRRNVGISKKIKWEVRREIQKLKRGKIKV